MRESDFPAKNFTCLLCGKPAESLGRDETDVLTIVCRRCGRFSLSFDMELLSLGDEEKLRLSAFCRRSSRTVITSDNVDALLSTVPSYTPLEKLDNLLLVLAERTERLGQDADFDVSSDYPLLISTPEEVAFLMNALKVRGFVKAVSMDSGDHITMEGWERVREIQKSGRDSKRAFVAMWFDESMNDLYDNAIATAITKARYIPMRIDRQPHVNRIDDEIIGQIKRCRFMVADFTGQRHSVYFEAGMMSGLGRNMIWMCKEDELDKLKFDVRQFSFIAYKDVADADKRLYNKIL